jgi:hypothetical protein
MQANTNARNLYDVFLCCSQKQGEYMTNLETVPQSQGDIWDNFNSYTYTAQNYVDFLPEDLIIMHGMMDGLETLGVQPYSEEVVADIGNGGTFEYSSVLQHLVRPDGWLEYLEYSPHGLQVACATLDRYRDTGDMGEWQKYGNAAVAHNPWYAEGPDGRFVHPTARSFQLGRAVWGNVYQLRPQAFGAAGSFFVAESITSERDEWNLATENVVNSVRMGGVVIMAAMRNSEGYTTPDPEGKIVFPAYQVYTADVVGRLEELGVQVIPPTETSDISHGIRPAEGPQHQGICLAMGIRAVEVAKPTIIV